MKKVIIAFAITLWFACAGFAQTSSTVLTNWMDLHARMVRASSGISHVAYSRHFSYASIAAYESIVAGNPGYRSLSGQLNGLKGLPRVGKNQYYWPASLNAAYADVLRKYYGSFGSCPATIDSMEAAQQQGFLKQHIKEDRIEKSVQYGKSVAAAILQWAEQDMWESKNVYKPSAGEGVWQPTTAAVVPFWADKRSLTKDLLSVYSLKQPEYTPDTNGMFYKMASEVYATSKNLTPGQEAIAFHWDDSPNGKYITVFGHWTYILSGLVKKHQLPLARAAEAYARMTIAMHEAGILAWKGKYQYNVVRPVTFIQQYINKNWQPLISTPQHPEFPAAHATLSNAAAVALCATFGEACAVTDNSYIDIGMRERSYSSLRDAAREAGMSRLYGGIHYVYSIEQGFVLGEAAAKFVERSVRFR